MDNVVNTPSVQKILSSVPQHASTIAIACISHLVTTKVQNPIALRQAFTKLKSSVIAWGNGRTTYGAGDANFVDTDIHGRHISKLGRKERILIWSKLEPYELLTLRLVCRVFKADIDYHIGLPVVVDQTEKNFYWLQNIVVSQCIVKDINSILDLNLLSSPEKLQKLVLNPSLLLTSEMLEILLNKFFRLKFLTMYMHEGLALQSKLDTVEPSTPALIQKTDKFLQIFGNRGKVDKINLRFDIFNWTLCWEIEFKSRNYEWQRQIQELTHAHFDYCLAPRAISQFWLDFMKKQKCLRTFFCNFGGVVWKEFKHIVMQNHYSLESIHLKNIVSWDNEMKVETFFDWAIFQGCNHLRSIKLSADLDMGNPDSDSLYMGMTNTVTLVDLETLQILKLEKFQLTQTDLRYMRILAGYSDFQKCICSHCNLSGTVSSLELRSPEMSSMFIHQANKSYMDEMCNASWCDELDLLSKASTEDDENTLFDIKRAIVCIQVLVLSAWIVLC